MSDLTVLGLSEKSKSERLLIRANKDIEDIRNYIVTDNTFDSGGNLSNLNRHIYRFSRKVKIEKDDIIALNTRGSRGRDYVPSDPNENNVVTHHFYWGLEKDVWNDDGDNAKIYKIQFIHSKRVHP